MHFRGIGDMNLAVIRGLRLIPNDVDLVVGIPRSGLLAAGMISLYLNRPLTDLEGLREGRLIGRGKRDLPNHGREIFENARRILVVDDCISTGNEIRRARQMIRDLGLEGRALFAAVYGFADAPPRVADLIFETIARPMCFQWSCMHTPGLEKQCVDIDGILCVDPCKEEDDDGPRYRRFIEQARPLIVPTREVGWLVTCRREPYRELTERWLERHNIRYRHLMMMDLPHNVGGEQRAAFKARVYRESGATMMIESSPGLARLIAELSGLPVMCYDTGTLHARPAGEQLELVLQRVGRLVRRARRAPRRLASLLTLREG